MSQITLREKQQALMHVAASRVAVLDSVTSAKEHASSCVRALPISPAVLMRAGAVAGAAASVVGAVVGLRNRRNRAEKSVSKLSAHSALSALVQVLLPVILPRVQRYILERTEKDRTLHF